jgi:hypothetical protein
MARPREGDDPKPRFAEDRCRWCDQHVGFGIELFHVRLCDRTECRNKEAWYRRLQRKRERKVREFYRANSRCPECGEYLGDYGTCVTIGCHGQED